MCHLDCRGCRVRPDSWKQRFRLTAGTVFDELVVYFRSSQKGKLAHAKMALHESVDMLCERVLGTLDANNTQLHIE